MEVKSTVKQFIVNEFMHEHDLDVLRDEDSLIESGIVDSMGLVKLVSFLEKKYRIKIKEDELDIDNFNNINALTNFINKKLL